MALGGVQTVRVSLTQQGSGTVITNTTLSSVQIVGTTFLTGPIGASGKDGATGPTGATGPAGPGIASGGNVGQYLTKRSSNDYDTQWVSVPTINDLAGKTITSAAGVQFILTVTDAGNLVTTLVGGASGNKYRATYAATY